MTLANQLMQDISKAIFDKGAGDIDPRRLAGISLGELLPFLEKNGINLTLGGQMSIEEMAMAIAEQSKPEGAGKVKDVDIQIIAIMEEPDETLFGVTPEQLMTLPLEKAEQWLDAFPPEILNHPLMVQKIKGLIRLYDLAGSLKGGTVPSYPIVEALKRRLG